MLQEIAIEISKNELLKNEFLKIDNPKIAIKILCSKIDKINKFLKNFGYRGLNELDLLGKSWIDHPELLQNTLKV